MHTSTDDYFSARGIRQRGLRRNRRRGWLYIHLALTIFMTGLLIAERNLYLMSRNNFPDEASSYLDSHYFSLHALIAAGIIWLLFVLHLIWSRFHSIADMEIDAEMREAREYEMQRYNTGRNAAYRLSDDGELFYDEDEIEYELKPKRRQE